MTKDEANVLRVTNLRDSLDPYLSDAARAAFAQKWTEAHSDLVGLARRYVEAEPSAEQLRKLGLDLSGAVETLMVAQRAVDGTLAPPMLVPLADNGCIVVVYARVAHAEQPEVAARVRELLKERHDLGCIDINMPVLPPRP